ncbi:MAG: purine-nucleoside phosphorylase [Chloroflexia bacterium]
MDGNLRQQIEEAAAAVRRRAEAEGAGPAPQVGIVLGSGLGELVEEIEQAAAVPYAEIPHFVPATVPGHAGRLILGRLAGRPVIVMQGRLHFYEGYTIAQTTFPIRVMRALGAEVLIVTNAAGGINPSFRVGDIMRIVDQINFPGMAGQNPLYGPNDAALGPRFLDMRGAYDPALGALADEVARDQGWELRHGVYAQLSGPSFETPAEVRFLRTIGVDAVGMSTAAEVVVARHGGMRVLGLSHISNVADLGEPAAPVGEDPHREVLEAGRRAVPRLVALIRGVLERLP